MLFTNREIAIMIWVNIFLIYCICKKDVRKSILNVIKSFFNKKLIILYLFIYTYLISIIFLLFKIGFWNTSLLKDTIIWVITVPVISILKATEDKKYFKETVKSCFEIYILIEFIGVNYPFNLWIELIIVPVVILFSFVGEFAEKLGSTKQVSNFANFIVITISIIAFIHSIRLLINDFQNIITMDVLKSIIFIPILTLAYIPITYIILVFMSYETIFLRINFKKYLTENEKKKMKFNVIRECKLNLNKIKNLKINNYIAERNFDERITKNNK